MSVGLLNVHFREHCFLPLQICAKPKDAGFFFIPSFALFPSGEDLVKFVHAHLSLTLANGCNPTTSFAQAFQHASSNDIHSRHDE